MFTGIIEETGRIEKVKMLDGGREFNIACSFAAELKPDESVSVNGACHTVVRSDEATFTIQSVEETLRKTSMGALKEGDPINLERSMTLDKRLDGHIVQGHVDAVGTVVSVDQEGTDWLFEIEFPAEFETQIVGRGSIALDGISLTVAREQANRFTVAIIPYTWDHTNLSQKKPGDLVNLEFDILGKYVLKYLSKLNLIEQVNK
ncbi:MAG: riboflavin synthase [Balneolaceae bacterium]|nr:MAG: riboflavin synthase [Balneolaceae bacterium]